MTPHDAFKIIANYYIPLSVFGGRGSTVVAASIDVHSLISLLTTLPPHNITTPFPNFSSALGCASLAKKSFS